MIDTVLFDMGGTLEEVLVDDESRLQSAEKALEILQINGVQTAMTPEEAIPVFADGWSKYNAYREKTCRELKPEEIWGKYVLTPFGLNEEKVRPYAEELAHMWEVTYHHRKLRDGAPEMLQGLKNMGMKLGIISNTASLYQVFDTLKEYGIRDFFQDVTLSSVTGYRKPVGEVFQVSLHQVQSLPERCAYVGDTISRDVIGAQNMGFGMTFRIDSFLTSKKDIGVPENVKPTYTINKINQVYEILRDLRRRGEA